MGLRLCASTALGDDDLAQLRSLFEAAWAGEGFTEEDWGHAFGGSHVLWERDGRILSHASVVPRTLRAGDLALSTGYVEAVATWPEVQRQGLGTAVMRASTRLVTDGYQLGALATGSQAFYARLGWEVWLGPLSVRTPRGDLPTPEEDGCVMVMRTPTTPALTLDMPLSCDSRPGDDW